MKTLTIAAAAAAGTLGIVPTPASANPATPSFGDERRAVFLDTDERAQLVDRLLYSDAPMDVGPVGSRHDVELMDLGLIDSWQDAATAASTFGVSLLVKALTQPYYTPEEAARVARNQARVDALPQKRRDCIEKWNAEVRRLGLGDDRIVTREEDYAYVPREWREQQGCPVRMERGYLVGLGSGLS